MSRSAAAAAALRQRLGALARQRVPPRGAPRGARLRRLCCSRRRARPATPSRWVPSLGVPRFNTHNVGGTCSPAPFYVVCKLSNCSLWQAAVITPSGSMQPSGGAPVATAPGHKPAGEEPPLISFD